MQSAVDFASVPRQAELARDHVLAKPSRLVPHPRRRIKTCTNRFLSVTINKRKLSPKSDRHKGKRPIDAGTTYARIDRNSLCRYGQRRPNACNSTVHDCRNSMPLFKMSRGVVAYGNCFGNFAGGRPAWFDGDVALGHSSIRCPCSPNNTPPARSPVNGTVRKSSILADPPRATGLILLRGKPPLKRG